jgi:hypothetical protein
LGDGVHGGQKKDDLSSAAEVGGGTDLGRWGGQSSAGISA